MICPNCKRELSQAANFCRYCGASLPKIDVAERPAQSQPLPVQPQTPPAQPQNPSASAKSRILPGALAGLALLLVLLGTIIKSTPSKQDVSPAQDPAETEATITDASTSQSSPVASPPQPESEAAAVPEESQEVSSEETVSADAASDESAEEPVANTPANEEPEQPQTHTLPDGEYILTVYSDKLYPTDEGVYADVDVSKYVTLNKDVLWDAEVGDVVDLTQFNAGFATVTNVSEESVTFADGTTEIERIVWVQSNDEPFNYTTPGSFIYRESFGCWRGIDQADPAYSKYYIGTSRVLFPPTTGITDYLSTMGRGGIGEYGMVHEDIRDYFALDSSDNPETASVKVSLQNDVVTEAMIPYRP